MFDIQKFTPIDGYYADPHGSLVQVADLEIHHGGLLLDRLARKVTMNGQHRPLTLHEFALLEYLLLRRGEVCPIAEIHSAIWPGKPTTTNIVNVYVNYLRRKLDHGIIRTVRGERSFIIDTEAR